MSKSQNKKMPMPVGIVWFVMVCDEPACRHHPKSRNAFAAPFSYFVGGRLQAC